jgi:hypothetical protein
MTWRSSPYRWSNAAFAKSETEVRSPDANDTMYFLISEDSLLRSLISTVLGTRRTALREMVDWDADEFCDAFRVQWASANRSATTA